MWGLCDRWVSDFYISIIVSHSVKWDNCEQLLERLDRGLIAAVDKTAEPSQGMRSRHTKLQEEGLPPDQDVKISIYMKHLLVVYNNL